MKHPDFPLSEAVLPHAQACAASSPDSLPTPCDPIIQLWCLRLLVPLQGHEEWISEGSYRHDRLAAALGLACPAATMPSSQAAEQLLAALLQRHQWAERHLRHWRRAGALQRSLSGLQQLVSLNTTEQRVLEFAICMHMHPALREAVEQVGDLLPHKAIRALSTVLGLPEDRVQQALQPSHALHRSGLLRFACTVGTLHQQLELISSEFAEAMSRGQIETQKVLRGMVCIAPAPQLELGDFIHLQHSLQGLLHYLRHSLHTGAPGANVLLYGPPGTGKTQLSRVLAHHCGCELFEVASQNCEGEPILGDTRLRAYRIAQALLGGTQGLLLFDEVDDVFLHSDFGSRQRDGQTHKPWLNHALEHNPLPTLWLSNSITDMDPSYIRRFDVVLELPVPPQPQRLRILQTHCGDWVPADALERFAQSPALTPAVVARASRVAYIMERPPEPDAAIHHACPDTTAPTEPAELARSAVLERLINSTLRAQGHPPLLRHDPAQLPEVYDPALLHADTDLSALAQGVARAGSARLCLYGPPGTGKTAYARWLAQQLQQPLHVHRASDLLAKYVGATEQNIAQAFGRAQEHGAVLLLDEVDSFLQHRRSAQRHWEVNQVNEMLTQMESFGGIFVASTNWLDGLDAAALRRFDLKVHFQGLQPHAAWLLFTRYCQHLQLGACPDGLQAMVQGLPQLTPGDFAAVARQHRFRPLASPEQLLAALQAECRLKPGQSRGPGFV